MEKIHPGNYGPLISILTWFLMVMMIFSVITRLGIRYSMVGKLQHDDYTMIAALVSTLQVLNNSTMLIILADFWASSGGCDITRSQSRAWEASRYPFGIADRKCSEGISIHGPMRWLLLT